MTAQRLAPRLLCLGVAVGVGFWAFSAYRALPNDGGIDHMADRVARGESYDLPILQAAVHGLDERAAKTCDAQFLTDAVILQAKTADGELASGQLDTVDHTIDTLGKLSSRLVSCVPTSSLGWLGLYRFRSIKDGFEPRTLDDLERSYITGPRESWIELPRNRLALAVFDQLRPDLQATVLDEFVDLIRIAEVEQAATRFVGLPPTTQRQVLDRVSALPDDLTWGFYKRVRRLGYEDVPRLGLPSRRDSPWID